MMDKYDKEEMLSDVREAMLYQLGADVSCEESVSYTHLDVYKRQRYRKPFRYMRRIPPIR